MILDIDYLNAQVIPGLTIEHAQDSLYEYIEGTLGLKVSFCEKRNCSISGNGRRKEAAGYA